MYAVPGFLRKCEKFFCRSKRFVYNMPWISMILESSSEDHFFWPVLSLPKCSFRDFFESKPIPKERKAQTLYIYIEQVISGLDFLHTKKLVHGEVSPDSIMVSADDFFGQLVAAKNCFIVYNKYKATVLKGQNKHL